MEHIGTRIKRFRRERDLTQEKLANYLNVSFQAISKWETGVASPDISLIVPLAKLLSITTDELLGVDTPDDKRKKELEDAYWDTWKTGDVAKQFEIAKTAVEACPGNFEYLVWLANAEDHVATHVCDDEEEATKLRESAVHHYEMVIEDCSNTDIRDNALHGIVLTLSTLDRLEEAKTYAMQYSNPDELLRFCLSGEELQRHSQRMIYSKLNALAFELNFNRNDPEAVMLEEAVIKAVVNDGNYLWFNNLLMHTFIRQAQCMTQHGRYDEAIAALRKSRFHAEEMERIDKLATDNPLPYTCRAFNLLTYEPDNVTHIGMSTLTEDFHEYLTWNCFAPLRDREDFKELFALNPLSQE